MPLALVEDPAPRRRARPRPEVPNAVAGRDAAFNVFVIGAPFGPPIEAVTGTAGVIDGLRPWGWAAC